MNAKHKHTPGPWRVAVAISSESQPWVYAREGHGSVCVLGTATERRFNDPLNSQRHAEGEANALLIASAPDMLAALEGLNHMGGDERGGYCICPRNDGSAPDGKHASCCEDARKAIRKATGPTD